MEVSAAKQPEPETDEKIASLVAGGNVELFSELMKRYEDKLGRYARKFLADHDDIRDVIQKIFIKVYENIQSFDATRRFSPWIYRIAHNELVNALKERQKSPLPLFDLDTFLPQLSFEPGVDERLDNGELKKALNQRLDQLPAKYKEPVILYYLEELSYKVIADVLQIPVSTVGVRIKRAKGLLKSLYQNNNRNHG